MSLMALWYKKEFITVGIQSTNRFVVRILGYSFLSMGVISYKERGRQSLSLSHSCDGLDDSGGVQAACFLLVLFLLAWIGCDGI